MQQTDRELVERVLNGDAGAFGELVRRYQGAVYGLAYHRVRHFADAQDIAQESFIKAFRKLRQLDRPDRFAVWLYAITVNECRMWQRQRREVATWEDAVTLSAVEVSTAETWERQELRAAVRQTVESLPEKDRLAVTLRYLAGLSCQEIGEFLNVPVTTVEGRLYRARRQLKKEMMAMVEESFAGRKLPEDFAQEVLKQLSLTPDDWVTTVMGEGTRTMIMGAAQGGKAAAIMALTMKSADQEAIMQSPMNEPDEVSRAKSRALECAKEILTTFDISMQQVVLRLEEEGQCRARATFKKGRMRKTLDMRPSDALALAARLNAPIYAEEPLLRQGKVGEDGLKCSIGGTLEAYRDELKLLNMTTILTCKAFDAGVSPGSVCDTARFRPEPAEGSLIVEVAGSEQSPVVVDLAVYGPALERLRADAERQTYLVLYHESELYREYGRVVESGLEIRFVPTTRENEPDIRVGRESETVE
jgi:RNA polymerase sigma-70 factor (ECF subfamily)